MLSLNNTRFLQATYPWKHKGQDKAFPAEAAQLQKDPVEIRTGLTLLPLQYASKSPACYKAQKRDSCQRLCLTSLQIAAVNNTFLPVAVCYCSAESAGNTGLFPVALSSPSSTLTKSQNQGDFISDVQPMTEQQEDSSRRHPFKPPKPDSPAHTCQVLLSKPEWYFTQKWLFWEKCIHNSSYK